MNELLVARMAPPAANCNLCNELRDGTLENSGLASAAWCCLGPTARTNAFVFCSWASFKCCPPRTATSGDQEVAKDSQSLYYEHESMARHPCSRKMKRKGQLLSAGAGAQHHCSSKAMKCAHWRALFHQRLCHGVEVQSQHH